MKTILITGAATFVGNRLAKILSKKNKYEIIATYNNSKPIYKSNKIKFLKINLSKKINYNLNFDILIHCAFKVPSNGLSKKNFRTNIEITKNLLELIKKKNCKKVIFLSAVSLYGQQQNITINELTKPLKPNLYGKAKITCENMIKKFCKTHDISFCILRLPGIVGKHSKNNFISNINNQIKKSKPFNVFNLNQKFNNVIHIELLGKIILKMINSKLRDKIYIVGSKYPITINKIINILSKKNKLKPKFNLQNSSKKNFLISSTKIIRDNYKIWSTEKTILNIDQ